MNNTIKLNVYILFVVFLMINIIADYHHTQKYHALKSQLEIVETELKMWQQQAGMCAANLELQRTEKPARIAC